MTEQNKGLFKSVASKLEKVIGPDSNGWYTALCPYHDDQHHPNLRFKKTGFKCMACQEKGSLKKLAEKLGIREASKGQQGTIVAEYDYRDEFGTLLYQVVRYEPKTFKQRRPDGSGGWIWNVKSVRRVLYRLPELLAAHMNAVVYIVEGEKDVDALRSLGLVVTCNSGGVGKFTEDLRELFKDRQVVIIADKDEPGRRHAQQVAELLTRSRATLKVIEIPGENVKDVTDWINAGGTREELEKLAVEAVEWSPSSSENEAPCDQEGRPTIIVSGRYMRDISSDAWNAIVAANEPPFLFRRGRELVDIVEDVAGHPILRTLDKRVFKGYLDRIANFQSIDREGKSYPTRPPGDVVEDMLTAKDLPLPSLHGLIHAPIFSPSGMLCRTLGYQRETSGYLFLREGISLPDVVQHPTKHMIAEARGLLLDDLLGDFLFVEDSDRANAVAMIELPFLRRLIRGPTPLHVIESPTPGTGKGLLADVLAIPASDRAPSVMTEGRDEDEWRKRITAKLLQAPQFVLIDNVRSRLDSAALSAALTSVTWEDRILGLSLTAAIPVDCVWLATANNPTLSIEVARRTVSIRLDAETERPWLRTGFRHPNLRKWTSEHRGELMWAALTLIQHWIDEGRPVGKQTLGSYEEYTEIIGGILDVAGINGFLDNRDRVYASADQEATGWPEFGAAWWRAFGDQEVGVEALFDLARREKLLVQLWGGRHEHSGRTRFGIELSNMRDQFLGGYRMRKTKPDSHTKAQRYRLEIGDSARVAEGAEGAEGSGPVFFREQSARLEHTTTIRKDEYISEVVADEKSLEAEKAPQPSAPSATLRGVEALEAEDDVGEV